MQTESRKISTTLEQSENQEISTKTINPEEFSCTFSTFASIGCDIDENTIIKQNESENPQSKKTTLFYHRGKRIIRYLYSHQINDKLNGNDRAFLDQQTPISQIEYYIPSLINTILISDNSICKVFSRLLFFKYPWLTLILSLSLIPLSTDIQLAFFPQQTDSGEWGSRIFISFILTFLYLATNLFGFAHDQNFKEFSPAQVDIEAYSKTRVHVKEYLIRNYATLERYLEANKNKDTSNKVNIFKRIILFVQNFIYNRFTSIGLLLTKDDVRAWIETATKTSIENLIKEGKAREKNKKFLTREEELIEINRELATNYKNEITKLKQEHDREILELIKKHKEEISKLNADHKKEVKNLSSSIEELSRESKKLKKDHENLLRTRGMTLDDLENCPTPVDDAAFPRVTIGLVVKTLRKKNPFVTRAVLALFITALVLSTKNRPLVYEDAECHSCKQFHAALFRTTWLALYSEDEDAIDAYNKETPHGLLSSNTLSSPLYVEDPRSTSKATKVEELEPNCSFSVWRTRRQPNKTMG